jgi:hypothetical protein
VQKSFRVQEKESRDVAEVFDSEWLDGKGGRLEENEFNAFKRGETG